MRGFGRAFDAAIRDELLDLGDVLDLGALPDDLQLRVSAGELSLEQARAILAGRERSASDGEDGGSL